MEKNASGRGLLVLIFLGIMIFAGMKLFGIFSEYKKGEDTYEQAAEEYKEESDSPISISFEDLLGKYPDVIGWIYCEGTPIDYPIVQGPDNDYYLKRMYNGSYNGNGSIFMDYRNRPDFSDWNNIIYGHNMDNDAMFGILTEYRKESFYQAHPVMYLSTPDKEFQIDLIGGYVTPADDSVTYSIPGNQDGRDKFLERVYRSSSFTSGVKVKDDEKLITLSTCTYEYDDARFVIVGVLRELSSENVSKTE